VEIVSLILGIAYVVVGVGGLLGVSLMPGVLQLWPYNTRFFFGNLEKTRKNRTIVSVLLLAIGLYLALADSLASHWRLLALGGLFVVTLIYIFVREPAEAGS